MVLERHRLAHHRDRVVHRVPAHAHRDPAEVARRVAALVQEAAREHRHLVDRPHEAVGREEGGLVALGLRLVALARRPGPRPAARAAVARAVDQDAAGHAGRDRRRRVPDDAAAAAAAVADLAEEAQVRDAQVARDHVLGRDLDAPLDHAVDVRRPEPGVLEGELRRLERGHLLGAADVLRERQLPDADDRGLVPERHGAGVAGSARRIARSRGALTGLQSTTHSTLTPQIVRFSSLDGSGDTRGLSGGRKVGTRWGRERRSGTLPAHRCAASFRKGGGRVDATRGCELSDAVDGGLLLERHGLPSTRSGNRAASRARGSRDGQGASAGVGRASVRRNWAGQGHWGNDKPPAEPGRIS